MILHKIFTAKRLIKQLTNRPQIRMPLEQLKTFDYYTYRHCLNVARESIYIGITMSLSRKELANLTTAALLHDVGKMDIDINILNKPARLTKEEFNEIKKHPIYSYNRLKTTGKFDTEVLEGVLYHHENYDGTGYFGIVEKDLSIIPRILRVADTYDAMTDNRCYKKKKSPRDAINEMEDLCTLDVDVVDAFKDGPIKGKKIFKN